MRLFIYFIIIVLTAGCFRTKRSAFDPSAPGGTLNALITVLNSSSNYEQEPVLRFSSSYTFLVGISETVSPTVQNVKSCSISPSLPAGLSLDTADCKISGTPTTAASTANYTVTAKNISKTATAVLAITVEKRYAIFVTNSSTQGSFTDSVCSSDLNKPSTGTFKAMIVSTTRRACSTANCSGGVSENLDWVFKANTMYYRTDRSTLVLETNSNGIFTSMNTAFGLNSESVWTGLNSNFTTSANTCSNWTNNTGGFQGTYGIPTPSLPSAYNFGSQICSIFTNVVCVEQ